MALFLAWQGLMNHEGLLAELVFFDGHKNGVVGVFDCFQLLRREQLRHIPVRGSHHLAPAFSA